MKLAFIDHKAIFDKTMGKELEYILEKYNDSLQILPIDTDQDIEADLKGIEGMMTAYLSVDAAFLDRTPNLKVISLLSTGYNTIDIAECKKRGIEVVNVQDYCTEEVATHTIALILALVRNLKTYDCNVSQGEWSFGISEEVSRISTLTLCIFGYGKIGRKVASIANALGMRVGVISSHLTIQQANIDGVSVFTKEQAMEEADIISNHMALSEETLGYFNSDFFNGLKKTPFFINVGRGGSVDEQALLDALDKKIVRGAGLDVLRDEIPDLNHNPFVGRKNVILTPHAAFYSNKSMQDLSEIACDNMIHALNGERNMVKGYVC